MKSKQSQKTNTVTYAWTPGRRGISPQPAQTPAWTFLRQITGASRKVINLPNGFFVCLNFSSCPSNPIRPHWSSCSPTASWAHTKRIALGQWGFPQPPYPAKKKKKKMGQQHQCQSSPVGVALGPAARGLVILCARSVVGTGPRTERNTRGGREEKTERMAQGDLVWKRRQRLGLCRDFTGGV